MSDGSLAEGLRGALAQWTMFAREAERDAQRRQRATTVELLQAARQIALGTQAVRDLTEQHDQQLQVLRSVRASSASALERIGKRLEGAQQVLEAAIRTVAAVDEQLQAGPRERAALLALRTQATAIVTTASSSVTTLQRAHDDLSSAVVSARRGTARHAEIATALAELRLRYEQMGQAASAALDSMSAAGRELGAIGSIYERAQLRSLDFRRDELPPPSGVPLQAPAATVLPPPLPGSRPIGVLR